jgi:hypothetical protein
MNPHVGTLFEDLNDHNDLSTITLDVDVASFGPQYSHLRKNGSLWRQVLIPLVWRSGVASLMTEVLPLSMRWKSVKRRSAR